MSEFKWDNELIMEYARMVACEYRNSEVWTDNYVAEEEIIKRFKASKQPKPEWEIVSGVSDKTPYRQHLWITPDCAEHGCGIYSIKRLSDGVLFTIGDEICELREQFTKRYLIKGFEITPLDATVIQVVTDEGLWALTAIRKAPAIKPHPAAETTKLEFVPAAANGKIPVWLTPEDEKKLHQLLESMYMIRFMSPEDHRKWDHILSLFDRCSGESTTKPLTS